MKKMKTYQNPENSTSIAAEPTATYGYTPNHVQALRNRIVDAVNETNDEERLMECMELLHADTMPCVYTDEEFEEIVRQALTDSWMENEDVERIIEEWECSIFRRY